MISQLRRLRLLLLVVFAIGSVNGICWLSAPEEFTRFIHFAQNISTAFTECVEYGKSRGFVSRIFIDADGSRYPYMVFIPHSMGVYERLPILLYLNGLGENGTNGIRHLKNGISHALYEDEANFPCVIIWPQCEIGDSWTQNGRSRDRAISILRQIAAEYHVDQDRIFVSGVSSGGTGTCYVAAGNQGLFAAAIPVSGTYDADLEMPNGLPLWTCFVSQDPQGPIDLIRGNHRGLIGQGESPHLSELNLGQDLRSWGHDAWGHAYRDTGMHRWLAKQNRTDVQKVQKRYKRIDSAVLGLPLSEDQVTVNNAASVIKDRVGRISISEGGPELTMSHLVSREFSELHLEFCAGTGINRFGVGLFGGDEENDSENLLVDLVIDDLNCGGLYSWPDHRCLRAFPLFADQGLRQGAWNDLRLRISQGRVSAELNGWELLEHVELPVSVGDKSIGFVAQGKTESFVEIRNPRFIGANPKGILPFYADDSVKSRQSPAVSQADDEALRKRRQLPEHNDTISVQSIVDCWKRREAATPTIHCRWAMERGIRFAASAFRPQLKSVKDVPVEETSLIDISPSSLRYSTTWRHRRIELTRMTGLVGAVRFEDFRRDFSTKFVNSFQQFQHQMQFESRINSDRRIDELYDRATGRGARGIAFDRPDVWADRIGDIDDLAWRGPLLAFRPLVPYGIGCRPEKCQVLPQRAWVCETDCAVLEETTQINSDIYQRRFWVDPAADFRILRCATLLNGKVREQIDVTYSTVPGQELIPLSWDAIARAPHEDPASREYVFAGDQYLFQMASAKVISCGPSSSPKDDSKISTFRPGTVSYDQSTKQCSRQIAVGKTEKLNSTEAITSVLAIDLMPKSAWTLKAVTKLCGWFVLAVAICWLVWRRLRRRVA